MLNSSFAGFDPNLLPSPAFVVDKAAIQHNLEILKGIMDKTGAEILLALKGFAMFHLAPQISAMLKGTASSSLHEACLARKEFGGQVHIYSPAYKEAEFGDILGLADHVIFNSFGQWQKYRSIYQELANAGKLQHRVEFGIRVNPEHSEGATDLYNPCSPFSRLGVTEAEFRPDLLEGLTGLHLHTLCEQGAEELERTLTVFLQKFGKYLKNMEWVNLGGGHHITQDGYNIPLLLDCITMLQDNYGLRVYLEPGEAIAIHSGVLLCTVLDIIHNQMDIAILDSSATCHTPDILEMPYRANIWGEIQDMPIDRSNTSDRGGKGIAKVYTYRLGGQSCLSGDIFGNYSFADPLKVGQRIVFDDMAHYTMVKTTTFNGVALPAICTYDSRNGKYEVVKTFGYEDFRSRLS